MLSFARTKIQPPRPRPGALLQRPALQQRLVASLTSAPLVLVCAAAGFGKTSALTQAIEGLPRGTAVAWVGCDEGDSPLQLFGCLVAALEPFDLPWRTSPEALLNAALSGQNDEAARQKALRAMAAELINALDAADVPHGVIFVDDLHRIDHPAVFQFLDLLLERFTPRWTLAIATRTEPPIALSRVRARGEAAEFRLDDLRFDPDQSRVVALAAGLDLSAADALFERTQGWPAGLQLALSVLRAVPGATLAGNAAQMIDRQVFDFLATEVLDRLPRELREFLVTTSVLRELTAARCAALTGDARAAEHIDAIERAGLFVTTLPEPEPTLRLHELFREALEQRLARERPEQFRELLRRAALGEPDGLRRVNGLMRAQAWSQAEAALCETGEVLMTEGAAPAVRSLYERFPEAQRRSSPGLKLLRTQLAWSRWDWNEMAEASAEAVAAHQRAGDAAGLAQAQSYRCLALVGTRQYDAARALIDALLASQPLEDAVAARALMAASWIELARGDLGRIAPLWTRLMDHLERLPGLVRWYECLPLPPFAGLPGMRGPLLRFVQQARLRWPERPTPARGMCAVVEGLLHLWAGDAERAQACATLASEESRWLAFPASLDAHATLLQALLDAVQGRGNDAQALLARQIDALDAAGDPARLHFHGGLYRFIALRCAAVAGDDAAMQQHARRVIEHRSCSVLTPAQTGSAPALLAAAQGDLESACRHWQALLECESEADLYGQAIETRLRLADALLQRGRNPRDAAAVLAPLFDRIAASGEWGTALMAGPAVLGRLAARDWAGTLGPTRGDKLSHWAGQARRLAGLDSSVADARGAAQPVEPEGLSAREIEVLSRIAAGDSNKLIARAFDLSPHTVKRHVANILDKLDLRSRGQAAAWYHANAPQ